MNKINNKQQKLQSHSNFKVDKKKQVLNKNSKAK